MLAAAVVAAVPAGAGAAEVGADAAKPKRVMRCPLPRQPKRACPSLRAIVPIGRKGNVARDTALQAFAATVARLPGVKARKGGYPHVRSASGPIRWVLRHWSRLSRAQRAAVRKALPGVRTPGARTAAAPRRARSAQLVALQKIADEGRALLNTFLAPDLAILVHVDVDLVWKSADAGAYAELDGGCRIAFPPGTDPDDVYVRELMLHELTHCYEFQLSPTPYGSAPWVTEGAAEWVQAVVSPHWLGAGYVSQVIRNDWKAYFKNFTAPLTQHAYTAMPYYAHLAHTYGQAQVFQTITAMFSAQPKDAYGIFTGGNPIHFLDTLAPSGTRLRPLGASWVTAGPHIPPVDQARYNPSSVAVGAGTVNLDTGAYRRTVVGLNPAKGAEAVKLDVRSPDSAWGLLHYEKGDLRVQDGDTYVCVGKQCTCPDGREIPRLGDDGYLALFAHRKTAKVRLKGAQLAEACDQDPSAMVVSGAFSMVVKERGSCGLKASEMGSKPLDALFVPGYSPSRPQGLGQVLLRVSGAGPGSYPSDIDKPNPSGSALVTRFGEPGGGAWHDLNRVGQEPIVRNFGTVTVNSVSEDGASGTVDMVLFAEPPEAPSQVHLTGRWSCAPYDKVF
jgi:hypothetical protein